MAIDMSKLNTELAKRKQRREQEELTLVASVIDTVNTKGVTPELKEQMNLLLNGDLDGLRAKLGEPTAASVVNSGILKAYEYDGTFLGTGFKSEEDANAAGFELWLETDGTVKGVRKPAPRAIVVGTTGDTIQVFDGRHNPVRKISLATYEADPSKFDVLHKDADGKPDVVVEKKSGWRK